MRVLGLMMVLVLSGPMMALAMQPPVSPDVVLVVLPPWRDGTTILAAIDGVPIRPERAPFAILVQSAHQDVAQAAYHASAWWIASGALIAALCGVML